MKIRCIKDFPPYLKRGVAYEIVIDRDASLFGMIRVVDESGNSQVYPVKLFNITKYKKTN